MKNLTLQGAIAMALVMGSAAEAAPNLWEARAQSDANTYQKAGGTDNECIGNASVPCTGGLGSRAETRSSAVEGGRFAESTASADLGTGEIKLFTNGTPGMADIDSINAAATAFGGLTDTIYFAGIGNDPVDVIIRFVVEGRFDARTIASTQITLSSGMESLFLQGHYNRGVCAQGGSCQTIGAGSTGNPAFFSYEASSLRGNWDILGPDIFQATVSILPGDPYLYLNQHVASGGLFADFSNTSTIDLILPKGVTFTSASGVFLTGQAAIPEPASWAMLIVGFGLAGTALRRRARGAPALTSA